MRIPSFAEAHHPVIKSLSHVSDQDLLTLFQRYPEQGKYFTAIFCRYSAIVYTLIAHSARSPVQADLIFALSWRHIFYEMRGLVLHSNPDIEGNSFQNWLINMTAFCINQAELPPVEAINYDLATASPPLWCYLEQALELLPPLARLIVVMADNFHWSETRIAAYLQAEGENLTSLDIKLQLAQGHRLLQEALPGDICEIYLDSEISLDFLPK